MALSFLVRELEHRRLSRLARIVARTLPPTVPAIRISWEARALVREAKPAASEETIAAEVSEVVKLVAALR